MRYGQLTGADLLCAEGGMCRLHTPEQTYGPRWLQMCHSLASTHLCTAASVSKVVSSWAATDRQSMVLSSVTMAVTSASVEGTQIGASWARRAEVGVSGCCGQPAVHRLSGRGQQRQGHGAAHIS